MATISDQTRHLVREKLAAAIASIRSGRETGSHPGMDFDRALRILDQCSAAVDGTDDIDHIADHLRAAERALEHCCTEPTSKCVAEAIHLIDKAIGAGTW